MIQFTLDLVHRVFGPYPTYQNPTFYRALRVVAERIKRSPFLGYGMAHGSYSCNESMMTSSFHSKSHNSLSLLRLWRSIGLSVSLTGLVYLRPPYTCLMWCRVSLNYYRLVTTKLKRNKNQSSLAIGKFLRTSDLMSSPFTSNCMHIHTYIHTTRWRIIFPNFHRTSYLCR